MVFCCHGVSNAGKHVGCFLFFEKKNTPKIYNSKG